MSCRDISSPISWRMYLNVPRVTLKLEYHSSPGKNASTMSNHAKEWGCLHISLKGVDLAQNSLQRVVLSPLSCMKKVMQAKELPCFVSDVRHAFSLFQNSKPHICFLYLRICHILFKQPAKTCLKSYVNRCHISAGTPVLVSGVPFRNRNQHQKKLEHVPVPCPKLSARVPKFSSAVPKMNVV